MHNQRVRVLWAALAAALLLGLALLAGCGGSDDGSNKPGDLTGTCVSCHQDQELLQATAEPVVDDGGGDAGEG